MNFAANTAAARRRTVTLVAAALTAGIFGSGIIAPIASHTTAHAAAQEKPMAVASGSFRKLAHRTVGKATIVKGKDGRRTLRLSGFETGKGPKLHLYLVAAADIQDNDAAKKLVDEKMIVDLGALKKIKGDQAYEIPASVDTAKYATAIIWCDQFDVTFGAAPLM